MAEYTQFGQQPFKYINGLRPRLSVDVPLTRIRVGAGSMLDDTGSYQMIAPIDMSCDIDKSGAGGLDTGTIQPNTIYGLYFITDLNNISPPSLLLSLSYGQSVSLPWMPYGYNCYGFIGCVRIDSLGHVDKAVWLGANSYDRSVVYNTPIKVLSNGNDANYTFVSLTGVTPTIAYVKVNYNIDFNANAAGDIVNLKYDLSNSAQVIITAPVSGAVAHTTVSATVLSRFTQSGPGMTYQVTGGSVDIYVAGYELFLPRG